MDQNPQELTLEESMKQVLETLPPTVRAYLTGGKYTPVAKSLMAKYNLRVDQSGVLEREIMLLLMGVETPDEFMQALLDEARLDQKTVNGIAQDVNTQIFVPLRAEEMKSDLAAGKPAQAPAPVRPVPAGNEQPKKYFHLENKITTAPPAVSTVRPLPPPVPQAPAVPLPPHIAPLPPKTALPASTAKVSWDMRPAPIAAPKQMPASSLLEDHEEPSPSLKATEGTAHIEFDKTAVPPNLPGAMQKPAASPTLSVGAPIGSVGAAPMKSYGADPYREPVDEPPTK